MNAKGWHILTRRERSRRIDRWHLEPFRNRRRHGDMPHLGATRISHACHSCALESDGKGLHPYT